MERSSMYLAPNSLERMKIEVRSIENVPFYLSTWDFSRMPPVFSKGTYWNIPVYLSTSIFIRSKEFGAGYILERPILPIYLGVFTNTPCFFPNGMCLNLPVQGTCWNVSFYLSTWGFSHIQPNFILGLDILGMFPFWITTRYTNHKYKSFCQADDKYHPYT